MYALEEVDVVFVGSSNVYRHFDPEIWDRSLEAKTFNAGTSVQAPDGAYYIMKELFKDQSPSYCIYGINYILFLELEAYNNPQNHYIIFDYLKPSINRCLYGYTVFRDKSMLNAWMPATRNANADLVSTAKDVMSIKMTSTYQKYGYDIYINSDDEEYQGRGFVYSNRQTKKGEVGKISGYIFSDYEISEKYIFYIKKLKMLCEANGCELVFVVPPLPYATMKRQENYQEILELYDKVIISISLLLEGKYVKIRSKLSIKDDSKIYMAFCMVRTWALLFIANVILQVQNFKDFYTAVRQIVGRSFFIGDYISLSALNWIWQDTVVLGVGLLILLLVSVGKEKNVNILSWLDTKILPIRWGVYYLLFFGVILFGMYGSQYDTAQFLYMQF